MCLCKVQLSEMVPSHKRHWCVFSPVCLLKCLVNSFSIEKVLSYWVLWYGLSPVWYLKCLSKLFFTKKALSHWHIFSPVWVLNLNAFQTYFHWEGHATLTVLIWFIPNMFSGVCQNHFHWEGIVTLITLIWFLSSVFSHMFLRAPFSI